MDDDEGTRRLLRQTLEKALAYHQAWERFEKGETDEKPEFDHWQWVSYWYPLNQVIAFKREVYRRAMKELALPLGRLTDKQQGN